MRKNNFIVPGFGNGIDRAMTRQNRKEKEMNYVSFINQMAKYSNDSNEQLNYLVSGTDPIVKKIILNDIFVNLYAEKKQVVVIDDAQGIINIRELRNIGFTVKNGLQHTFFNLFENSIKGRSRLRCLLDVLGYTEQQKQRVNSYLSFVRHVQSLRDEKYITLDVLSEYSSNMLVEQKIQQLCDDGIITHDNQLHLLGKYSEVCCAAADFENTILSLTPFIDGEPLFDNKPSSMRYIRLQVFGDDIAMKKALAYMIDYSIEDNMPDRTALVVLDKGRGDRSYLTDLISCLNYNVQIYLISEDIFTLGSELNALSNMFPVKIYSRHNSSDSAAMIENELGEIDIIKESHTVTYDRRWRAHSVWDMLWGNNKTEAYTANAPCREPKYRKEMILNMHECAIIDYKGNSTVFSI